MIKIAIAGTGGLAQYIAHFISNQTNHHFILLSRQQNPGLVAKGWQVIKVDYSNRDELRYSLTGVDTVISTISGAAQISLIDAAAHVHVRRFVPSEFEGRPALSPQQPDALDRGKAASLTRLQYYQKYGMEYTCFVCGIFYERFAPGGMASLQLGHGTNISGEGDYVMDIRKRKAHVPFYSNAGQVVRTCMTSAEDVARFVVAALELPQWPTEFRMRGDRMSVSEIVQVAEAMTGGTEFEKVSYTEDSLQDSLTYARALGNVKEQWRLHHLIATAANRYDFQNPNLNGMVPVQPRRFRDWLYSAWA
ncbi:hypothetical protein FQN54_003069 [Arachnomyces sp. PD_36]|nr:hypothetical protein FQN54_003069 [Arachnomyces sp. PD_36]